jgi:hypothetical protein
LLDEVVIGKQEMVGAIDAVCDVANASSASSCKALAPEDRRCSAVWSAVTREFVHQRRR